MNLSFICSLQARLWSGYGSLFAVYSRPFFCLLKDEDIKLRVASMSSVDVENWLKEIIMMNNEA